jgi:hypothetical protein
MKNETKAASVLRAGTKKSDESLQEFVLHDSQIPA